MEGTNSVGLHVGRRTLFERVRFPERRPSLEVQFVVGCTGLTSRRVCLQD